MVLLLICPCGSGELHTLSITNKLWLYIFFKNNTSAVGMGISHWSIIGQFFFSVMLFSLIDCYFHSLIAEMKLIIHHRAKSVH